MRIPKGVTVVASLVVFHACGESEPQESGKAVVVLLEPNPALHSLAIERAIPLVLDAIRPADALALVIVGDRTQPGSLIAQEAFPAFKPTTDNRLLRERQRREHEERHEAQLAQIREELHAAIEAAFARDREGLALLSSMELAERLFATYRDRQPVLVVLSSMQEQTDRLDLRARKPTAQETASILTELQAEDLLPNLSGTRVYVGGAQDRDPGHVEVRDFWHSYFNAAGANIRREDYGAALLRQELD